MTEFPSLAQRRALTERYAALVAALAEELGQRPLVLPTGAFFPDTFTGDQASVQRFVARLQEHAGMTDVPIEVMLVGQVAGGAGSCGSSGGCCGGPVVSKDGSLPRVVEQGEGWLLQVPAEEVSHPTLFAAQLARALGLIFLQEVLPEGEEPEPPLAVSLELTAVALGFGVLLLEASHVYRKSCGGPSVSSFTELDPASLALATALFIEQAGHGARPALKALAVTQRELLERSLAWVRSNRALVDALRSMPESVALGMIDVREERPWLARVLGA